MNPQQQFDSYSRKNRDYLLKYITVMTGDSNVAEDILQEALIYTWSRWNEFDAIKNFNSLVFHKAKFLYIDKLRHFKKRRNLVVLISLDAKDTMGNCIWHSIEDRNNLIENYIDNDTVNHFVGSVKMHPKYLEFFRLHKYHEIPSKQLAEYFDIPERTIRTRAYRATKILKKEWEKYRAQDSDI